MVWCKRHTAGHAVRWGKAQPVSMATHVSSAWDIPTGRPESTSRLLWRGLPTHRDGPNPARLSLGWKLRAASRQGASRPVVQLPRATAVPSTASAQSPAAANVICSAGSGGGWRGQSKASVARYSAPEVILSRLQLMDLNWRWRQEADFVSGCCCWSFFFQLCELG